MVSVIFLTSLIFSSIYSISGQECYIEGSCKDYDYAAQRSESLNECIEYCKSRKLCNWSTWDPVYKICTFFSNCPEIDQEYCPRCLSSQKICNKVGNTKLLVTTGLPAQNGSKSEVIDLLYSNRVCERFEDFPEAIFEATGGLLLNKYPIICGGTPAYSTHEDEGMNCFVLKYGETGLYKITLMENRTSSAGIVLADSFWVTGGLNKSHDSTEIIQLNKTSKGPKLPHYFNFKYQSHSIAKIDNALAVITEGKNALMIDISDIENLTINAGPGLIHERYYHASGTFNYNGTTVVIVAGGDVNGTQSCEYWDLDLNHGWVQGT